MPRQARLDSPGLLHHVMARGLDRQPIFKNDADRIDFLRRIEKALKFCPNEILAWALMPNHLHLLIRSGVQGLSPLMRRVMTGYALAFNQRHKRVGYLFQGRFKSLVCDEEEYFLTLLRYIHLNPVSAGIVSSIEALKHYPYTGHSALMGKITRTWQSCDEALSRFGRQAGLARRRYETFCSDGVQELRHEPTDLLGAGIIQIFQKSSQEARRESDRAYHDARVLGESEFVEEVLRKADKEETIRQALKHRKIDVRVLASRIAKTYDVEVRQLFERGREGPVSAAKAGLIYAGVQYLGKTNSEMAKLTRMSSQAASRARMRGAEIHKSGDLNKLIS